MVENGEHEQGPAPPAGQHGEREERQEQQEQAGGSGSGTAADAAPPPQAADTAAVAGSGGQQQPPAAGISAAAGASSGPAKPKMLLKPKKSIVKVQVRPGAKKKVDAEEGKEKPFYLREMERYNALVPEKDAGQGGPLVK